MDMNTATLPKKGLKKYDYNIDMEKKDLEKLTKDQLIELLLKQKKSKKPKVVIVDDTKPTRLNRPPPIQEVVQRIKPTPPPRTGKWENVKPKPVPRKSVKQMVKEFEDHIIQTPEQFRDGYKPIPKPRTDDRLPLQMRRYPKPTRKAPPIPQVEDHIIQPPEQFRDRRPPKPTRKPPLPPTPKHEFNFDDDIIQTENTSLGKFKIISVQSSENKKFKSYTKLKSLKNWTTLKRYTTFSKN